MSPFWRGALVLAVILAGLVVYRNVDLRHAGVPGELYGVWRTDEAAYADRSFELKPGFIVVGQGDEKSSVETVSNVESKVENGHTTYIVHAVSFEPSNQPEDKHEVLWFLDYDAAGGGTIRLKDRPKMVWRRMAYAAPTAVSSPQ